MKAAEDAGQGGRAAAERAPGHEAARGEPYDPRTVQEKWQERWAALDPFRASDDASDGRPRTYLLDMFPYPSGDLHMGHAEAYAIGDAVARYFFQRGHNVLHPIGWDAFGLPAENAAIRNNSHPADWTYKNIDTQAASFRRYAVSFDWSRRLYTCDPSYYRWNQWLFLRFYERGLAYRKDGYVNWCPVDQTVLANEQVIAGRCERCGAEVVRRVLTQWYFRITEYADRLLDGDEGAGRAVARAGPDDAAELDRAQRGRRGAVHDRGPGRAGHRVHDPPGHAVRGDVLRHRGRLAAGRRGLCAGTARRAGRVPDPGAQADRHRAPGNRARKDRSVPGQVRDQPGQRRAHPGLGRRLRAAGLRHRRDHGRARARSAGPGFRPGVRAAGPRGGADRFARPGGDRGRHPRRRQSWSTRARSTGCPRPRRSRRSSTCWPSVAWAARRSITGCATGCCRGSGSGARRSRSCTARRAARCRCRTSSFRCSCPTCAARTWRRRVSLRWRRPRTG